MAVLMQIEVLLEGAWESSLSIPLNVHQTEGEFSSLLCSCERSGVCNTARGFREQSSIIPFHCIPMSEIVVLQFGEAANAVGSIFWGLQVGGLVFSF